MNVKLGEQEPEDLDRRTNETHKSKMQLEILEFYDQLKMSSDIRTRTHIHGLVTPSRWI